MTRDCEALLLQALACGATVEVAAQQAGVHKRTAYRKLADPDFKRRVERARAEMVHRAGGVLTAAALEAVRTLCDLQGKDTPPSVRLGAAKAVLELGLKVREACELEERLAELEARLAADQGRGGNY